MRRRGELSPAAIDRSWPHQIALPARFCEKGGYKEIHDFCKDLTLCTRGHAVYDNSEWFHVYCFANPEDADKFNQHFGGDILDLCELPVNFRLLPLILKTVIHNQGSCAFITPAPPISCC